MKELHERIDRLFVQWPEQDQWIEESTIKEVMEIRKAWDSVKERCTKTFYNITEQQVRELEERASRVMRQQTVNEFLLTVDQEDIALVMENADQDIRLQLARGIITATAGDPMPLIKTINDNLRKVVEQSELPF